MGVVPTSRIGKLEFYESHLPPWTANVAAIGLTVDSVANLAALTGAARTAYNAHLEARAAARAATAAFHDKVRELHSDPGAGSDMIAAIKNFAQSTDNPEVYTLAQIPAPATPTPAPPPGTPFDFSVSLDQNGALELRWKCANAGVTGTVYEILRQTGGAEAPFAFVGTAGSRSFLDETLPANAGAAVTYQVTAVRSTARGKPAQFTVKFGVAGGSLTASIADDGGAPVRMAA